MKNKYFFISIDTEGDNSWACPQNITTKNARSLIRFQALCEKYKLLPTYLTNYEMVKSEFFKEFGQELLLKKNGEIGMHLHPWNSPPDFKLTDNDLKFQPYLIEYPENIMENKIKYMTDLLEETFNEKMVTHRAGRWSFDKTYAKLLVKYGYKIDCSVTPHKSWKNVMGAPDKNGGTDFSNFPEDPYFIDLNDISQKGNSPLLEIPMTIISINTPLSIYLKKYISRNNIFGKILNRIYPHGEWFRPLGNNKNMMFKIIKHILISQKIHLQFMIHSSELLEGENPTFKTKNDIEKLYGDLEELFSFISENFISTTHKGFYESFKINHSL